MIDPKVFLELLQSSGVEFFAGVPDSYLNGFCNYLSEKIPQDKHMIAANEGNAVALGAGYYFATGTVPLVYLQNSGLGNTVNPLVSLADQHVFKVPLLLLIGWRGEPGVKDWAQHRTQGEITPELLDLMGIPWLIVEDDRHFPVQGVKDLIKRAKEERRPVALIGRKGVFSSVDKDNILDHTYPLSREEAIEAILDALPSDTVYAATTGRATRELFYLRQRRGEGHQYDFLNVGAMGHTSSLALGMALARKNRLVVCLDGDSAAIMHMGALAIAGGVEGIRFLHVILNNGAHESVGGQASAGYRIDFTAMAAACGYRTISRPVITRQELSTAAVELSTGRGAAFIDVRIHKGLKGALPPLDIDHKKLIDGLMAQFENQVPACEA